MPIKNQPHCLCYEFNYQINRNNFDRGFFLNAVGSIFWMGAEMKTYLGITEFGWALFIYLGVLTLFVMAVVG